MTCGETEWYDLFILVYLFNWKGSNSIHFSFSFLMLLKQIFAITNITCHNVVHVNGKNMVNVVLKNLHIFHQQNNFPYKLINIIFQYVIFVCVVFHFANFRPSLPPKIFPPARINWLLHAIAVPTKAHIVNG